MGFNDFLNGASGAGIPQEGVKVEQVFHLKSEDLLKVVDQMAEYKFELMKQAEREKSEDDLLSPEQVCQLLGVARSTLTRWQNAGYLVPAKVGGKSRFRKSQIEAILNTKIK